MTSLSDLDERPNPILSADIEWAPPATVLAGRSDTRHASFIGAAVAAGICFVIATAGAVLTPYGWLLGIVGLPATTFLAWQMAPGTVATRKNAAIPACVVPSPDGILEGLASLTSCDLSTNVTGV